MSNAALDPRVYIKTQQQETYRAFIVYAPAMNHKTEWAKRLSNALDNVALVDLQTCFVEHTDLAGRVDRFRPSDLETLLLELDIPEPVIVIDNMDFLMNIWTPPRQDEFLAILERRFKSPGVTSKTFVFVTQDHPLIMRATLTNSLGQPRVLPLSQFKAI